MVKNTIFVLLSASALIVIPFMLRVRGDIAEVVAMSKYQDLLTSSAVIENPPAVTKVTGKTNDWTAVPHYLYGSRNSIDMSVVLMLLPNLIILMISGASLFVEFRSRQMTS
jgi:hypothetical protein